MKTRIIRLAAALLGLVLPVLAIFFGQAVLVQAHPGVLYVAAGNCGSLPGCYHTLQAAVDAAAAGDEIRVAGGTYSDISVRPRNDITSTGVVSQVVAIHKTLTLRGGYNAGFTDWNPALYVTTLNAQGRGRGIYISGEVSPTIQGLSITGGSAKGLTGYSYFGIYDVGGGVYGISATVTLIDNHIFSNTAPYGGGGVFLANGASLLKGNTIAHNTVKSGGGGVFLYRGSGTLSGNAIMANTSNNLGGGLYLFSTNPALRGNTISDNTTVSFGGGVDVASCDPTFSGNIISGNSASKGGGVYLWYSRSVLTNNVIIDNQANSLGSGIWIGGSTPQLLHNTFARNSEGDGSGVFATDDGSGTNSRVTLTNTLLVSQTVGIYVNLGSTARVNGILWSGNGSNSSGGGAVSVTHATTGSPAFAVDGYHLKAGSAAKDHGVSAGVASDVDNQPRSGVPDLGADEYWAPGSLKTLYLPLTTRP